MDVVLAVLPFQNTKSDIVQGNAKRLPILGVAMLNHCHATIKVNLVSCQIEYVSLAQAGRQGEQNNLALMSRQTIQEDLGLSLRQIAHPDHAGLAPIKWRVFLEMKGRLNEPAQEVYEGVCG